MSKEIGRIFSMSKRSNIETRVPDHENSQASDQAESQETANRMVSNEGVYNNSGKLEEDENVNTKTYENLRFGSVDMSEDRSIVVEERESDQDMVNESSQKESGTSGDSTTLYLREMGRASLLTREEEVLLAKQIEKQQEIIKESILEVPFAFVEIRRLCKKARERKLSRLSPDHPSATAPTSVQKSNRLSLL